MLWNRTSHEGVKDMELSIRTGFGKCSKYCHAVMVPKFVTSFVVLRASTFRFEVSRLGLKVLTLPLETYQKMCWKSQILRAM